jgi:glycosyltransferase involved in cell wall biosynthesis
MIKPKISIITASYNSEKTIKESMESVLNQSYQDIEYIVIDGNSSDSTVTLLKEAEILFDGKMKWISEKDSGIYDAWNKGVKMASGDWILFLGTDDFLTQDALTKYVEVLQKNPTANFISSRCTLITVNKTPLRTYGKGWSSEMNKYCVIAHVASLHHKSLFASKGVFNDKFKISGDYDFLLRCRDIIKPYFINYISAYVQEGGISAQNIWKISKERKTVKLNNKTRTLLQCQYDHCVTILKFYIRSYVLNPLVIFKSKYTSFK